MVVREIRCQTVADTLVSPKRGTSFGIEVGYGYRTDKISGATLRALYAAPFGDIDIEGGVRYRHIDEEFGFDLHVRIPFAEDAFHIIGGFGLAVHPYTVAAIIPLGGSYIAAKMIEFSLLATPNLYLTKLDKNTLIFEGRIGIRF